MTIPWPIAHATTFPFAAWQLLFVAALTLGYHRADLAAWFARESRPPAGRNAVRAGLAAAACGLLLLGGALTTGRAQAMELSLQAVATADLFDKATLGIGRLAAFAAVALLIYGGLTLFWRPIERALGWLLIPLGQASLYAYAVHLFLILVAYNVPPYVGSDQPGWELHNTLGQLALVLVIWAMVKRKVLFGIIPR